MTTRVKRNPQSERKTHPAPLYYSPNLLLKLLFQRTAEEPQKKSRNHFSSLKNKIGTSKECCQLKEEKKYEKITINGKLVLHESTYWTTKLAGAFFITWLFCAIFFVVSISGCDHSKLENKACLESLETICNLISGMTCFDKVASKSFFTLSKLYMTFRSISSRKYSRASFFPNWG